MTGLMISPGAIVLFLTVVCLVGPALFYIGRLSQRVTHNENDIKVIFQKIDLIHEFVKNRRT